MTMAKLLLAVIAVLVFAAGSYAASNRDRNDYTKNPYRVVCYFGSWANYHKAEPFLIEDVNIDLCTHVNYGFAKIDEYNYTIQPFDPYLDTQWDTWDKGAYKRFNDLRLKNPHLTTMISLGGWYEGSEKYSDMANDPKLRSAFVASVVDFLKTYDFDGIDLDWEYPANRLGKPYDRENYITLLSELKDAFAPHGYLLTAALSPGKPTIDRAYDKQSIAKFNELLDWGNIMTYDYHGGWENQLGHNAPLYRRPDETDDLHIWFNVNYTIHYYLELGMRKDKMVMGVPMYGRAWTLISPDKHHLNDTVKGMSPPGEISGEGGVLGYNEICQKERAHPDEWTNEYDPYYRAPYAYNKTIWVGYDNTESLSCKISFLKQMGLSGGMVWSLETDDFKGRCGGGAYPLLHRVHSMLNGEKKNSFECNLGDVPTTTTPRPTTTEPTTTEPTTRPTTRPTTTEPTTEPTTPTTTEPTTEPTTPTTTPPTTPTTKPTTTPTTPTTPEPTTPTTPEPTTPTPKPTTTEEPETASPVVTMTLPNGKVIRCYKEGKIAHPTDIHKYVVCEYVNGGWYIHIMGCAPGTIWYQPKQKCIDDN